MTAEAVLFRELTGSERSVELRDRALPYRPVAFGGRTEHKKRWYAGNPVATVQILNPVLKDTELRGTWKSRYISDMVTLDGFDDLAGTGDPVTAEIMNEVFTRLQRAGNLIEVQWGPIRRRGFIEDFTPNFQRVEDIEWSMNLSWIQIGEREAPRAASSPTTQRDLDAALNTVDDVMARMPGIFLPNVTGPLILAQEAIRLGMMTLTSQLSSIYGIPDVSLEEFRGVATTVEEVLDAARSMVSIVGDQSLEEFIATDDVPSVLDAITWRTEAHQAALTAASESVEARESIRSRVVDDYLGVDVVGDNQTLRTVSLKWYGTSEAWQTIADANGLVGSNQPSGTRVLIPRRSMTGTGASV